MSDLDLIESPSADQARTCLKLVFAASHTMIFERQCQRAAFKHNGRCAMHGGLSTGARTPEGLQRISAANLKHGRQTKDKLEPQRHAAMVGRQVMGELTRLEKQILDAGLMPDDK